MWFQDALVISLLAALGRCAALPESDHTKPYDAIIIGGGPAGLSALSGLARVRRNVLLIDSGVYRNDPTRRMHDVLGFDGVTPAYFRDAARKQISYYDTVEMKNGTVTAIVSQNNLTSFSVTAKFVQDGEKTLVARKIVLATGMRDVLPSTPGIAENWGKGIYWCPWCDGHETADQPLGILAPLNEIASSVREILTLNKDIVAFVNGTDTPQVRAKANDSSPNWDLYLKIHNVTVENRTIEYITRLRADNDTGSDPSLPSVAHHDLFSVEFASGSPVQRAGFFASFPSVQASDLAPKMGIKMLGEKIGVDEVKGMITSLSGVYAVGDANSDNATNVPHALYSGKRAAVFLHVALERENALQEIADAKKNGAQKRRTSLDVREAWDVMNGSPGEPLYAGEF
ncbi:sulphydryl oxidase [Thozetella sp. PMI_491]|nr:sulphydryl oxidase [Thozetella sp. PMI_491]